MKSIPTEELRYIDTTVLQEPAIRQGCTALWKEVFGDDDEYIDMIMDMYFDIEKIDICEYHGEIIAMVFSFDSLIFNDENQYGNVKVSYIFGVATKECYRGNNIFLRLMKSVEERSMKRSCDTTILIPASASLFNLYRRVGYSVSSFLIECGCNVTTLSEYISMSMCYKIKHPLGYYRNNKSNRLDTYYDYVLNQLYGNSTSPNIAKKYNEKHDVTPYEYNSISQKKYGYISNLGYYLYRSFKEVVYSIKDCLNSNGVLIISSANSNLIAIDSINKPMSNVCNRMMDCFYGRIDAEEKRDNIQHGINANWSLYSCIKTLSNISYEIKLLGKDYNKVTFGEFLSMLTRKEITIDDDFLKSLRIAFLYPSSPVLQNIRFSQNRIFSSLNLSSSLFHSSLYGAPMTVRNVIVHSSADYFPFLEALQCLPNVIVAQSVPIPNNNSLGLLESTSPSLHPCFEGKNPYRDQCFTRSNGSDIIPSIPTTLRIRPYTMAKTFTKKGESFFDELRSGSTRLTLPFMFD